MTSVKQRKKGGLGRGLDALFQDEESRHYDDVSSVAVDSRSNKSGNINELSVGDLVPGKYQPRSFFSDEKMQQLVSSVKIHGVLQPLLVRPLSAGGYEIIAGERRWRAAQKAQLHNVPVVIKDISDKDALEISLIENLQRQDLDALEEAEGYKRLIEEFSYKQEELATHLGKSRSHIANMMRLLALPLSVQTMVREEKISTGHARAILSATNIEQMARLVVNQGFSVRETEKYIQKQQEGSKATKKKTANNKTKIKKSVDVLSLEKEISSLLGMKVLIDAIDDNPQHGRVSVEYMDLDQLDSLLEKLSV